MSLSTTIIKLLLVTIMLVSSKSALSGQNLRNTRPVCPQNAPKLAREANYCVSLCNSTRTESTCAYMQEGNLECVKAEGKIRVTLDGPYSWAIRPLLGLDYSFNDKDTYCVDECPFGFKEVGEACIPRCPPKKILRMSNQSFTCADLEKGCPTGEKLYVTAENDYFFCKAGESCQEGTLDHQILGVTACGSSKAGHCIWGYSLQGSTCMKCSTEFPKVTSNHPNQACGACKDYGEYLLIDKHVNHKPFKCTSACPKNRVASYSELTSLTIVDSKGENQNLNSIQDQICLKTRLETLKCPFIAPYLSDSGHECLSESECISKGKFYYFDNGTHRCVKSCSFFGKATQFKGLKEYSSKSMLKCIEPQGNKLIVSKRAILKLDLKYNNISLNTVLDREDYLQMENNNLSCSEIGLLKLENKNECVSREMCHQQFVSEGLIGKIEDFNCFRHCSEDKLTSWNPSNIQTMPEYPCLPMNSKYVTSTIGELLKDPYFSQINNGFNYSRDQNTRIFLLNKQMSNHLKEIYMEGLNAKHESTFMEENNKILKKQPKSKKLSSNCYGKGMFVDYSSTKSAGLLECVKECRGTFITERDIFVILNNRIPGYSAKINATSEKEKYCLSETKSSCGIFKHVLLREDEQSQKCISPDKCKQILTPDLAVNNNGICSTSCSNNTYPIFDPKHPDELRACSSIKGLKSLNPGENTSYGRILSNSITVDSSTCSGTELFHRKSGQCVNEAECRQIGNPFDKLYAKTEFECVESCPAGTFIEITSETALLATDLPVCVLANAANSAISGFDVALGYPTYFGGLASTDNVQHDMFTITAEVEPTKQCGVLTNNIVPTETQLEGMTQCIHESSCGSEYQQANRVSAISTGAQGIYCASSCNEIQEQATISALPLSCLSSACTDFKLLLASKIFQHNSSTVVPRLVYKADNTTKMCVTACPADTFSFEPTSTTDALYKNCLSRSECLSKGQINDGSNNGSGFVIEDSKCIPACTGGKVPLFYVDDDVIIGECATAGTGKTIKGSTLKKILAHREEIQYVNSNEDYRIGKRPNSSATCPEINNLLLDALNIGYDCVDADQCKLSAGLGRMDGTNCDIECRGTKKYVSLINLNTPGKVPVCLENCSFDTERSFGVEAEASFNMTNPLEITFTLDFSTTTQQYCLDEKCGNSGKLFFEETVDGSLKRVCLTEEQCKLNEDNNKYHFKDTQNGVSKCTSTCESNKLPLISQNGDNSIKVDALLVCTELLGNANIITTTELAKETALYGLSLGESRLVINPYTLENGLDICFKGSTRFLLDESHSLCIHESTCVGRVDDLLRFNDRGYCSLGCEVCGQIILDLTEISNPANPIQYPFLPRCLLNVQDFCDSPHNLVDNEIFLDTTGYFVINSFDFIPKVDICIHSNNILDFLGEDKIDGYLMINPLGNISLKIGVENDCNKMRFNDEPETSRFEGRTCNTVCSGTDNVLIVKDISKVPTCGKKADYQTGGKYNVPYGVPNLALYLYTELDEKVPTIEDFVFDGISCLDAELLALTWSDGSVECVSIKQCYHYNAAFPDEYPFVVSGNTCARTCGSGFIFYETHGEEPDMYDVFGCQPSCLKTESESALRLHRFKNYTGSNAFLVEGVPLTSDGKICLPDYCKENNMQYQPVEDGIIECFNDEQCATIKESSPFPLFRRQGSGISGKCQATCQTTTPILELEELTIDGNPSFSATCTHVCTGEASDRIILSKLNKTDLQDVVALPFTFKPAWLASDGDRLFCFKTKVDDCVPHYIFDSSNRGVPNDFLCLTQDEAPSQTIETNGIISYVIYGTEVDPKEAKYVCDGYIVNLNLNLDVLSTCSSTCTRTPDCETTGDNKCEYVFNPKILFEKASINITATLNGENSKILRNDQDICTRLTECPDGSLQSEETTANGTIVRCVPESDCIERSNFEEGIIFKKTTDKRCVSKCKDAGEYAVIPSVILLDTDLAVCSATCGDSKYLYEHPGGDSFKVKIYFSQAEKHSEDNFCLIKTECQTIADIYFLKANVISTITEDSCIKNQDCLNRGKADSKAMKAKGEECVAKCDDGTGAKNAPYPFVTGLTELPSCALNCDLSSGFRIEGSLLNDNCIEVDKWRSGTTAASCLLFINDDHYCMPESFSSSSITGDFVFVRKSVESVSFNQVIKKETCRDSESTTKYAKQDGNECVTDCQGTKLPLLLEPEANSNLVVCTEPTNIAHIIYGYSLFVSAVKSSTFYIYSSTATYSQESQDVLLVKLPSYDCGENMVFGEPNKAYRCQNETGCFTSFSLDSIVKYNSTTFECLRDCGVEANNRPIYANFDSNSTGFDTLTDYVLNCEEYSTFSNGFLVSTSLGTTSTAYTYNSTLITDFVTENLFVPDTGLECTSTGFKMELLGRTSLFECLTRVDCSRQSNGDIHYAGNSSNLCVTDCSTEGIVAWRKEGDDYSFECISSVDQLWARYIFTPDSFSPKIDYTVRERYTNTPSTFTLNSSLIFVTNFDLTGTFATCQGMLIYERPLPDGNTANQCVTESECINMTSTTKAFKKQVREGIEYCVSSCFAKDISSCAFIDQQGQTSTIYNCVDSTDKVTFRTADITGQYLVYNTNSKDIDVYCHADTICPSTDLMAITTNKRCVYFSRCVDFESSKIGKVSLIDGVLKCVENCLVERKYAKLVVNPKGDYLKCESDYTTGNYLFSKFQGETLSINICRKDCLTDDTLPGCDEVIPDCDKTFALGAVDDDTAENEVYGINTTCDNGFLYSENGLNICFNRFSCLIEDKSSIIQTGSVITDISAQLPSTMTLFFYYEALSRKYKGKCKDPTSEDRELNDSTIYYDEFTCSKEGKKLFLQDFEADFYLECHDDCAAKGLITLGEFCVTPQNCYLIPGYLKDGNSCVTTCSSQIILDGAYREIECVDSCPSTYIQVGKYCYTQESRHLPFDKSVEGLNMIDFNACPSDKVIVPQDLFDQTTTNECISKAECGRRWKIIHGRYCLEKCSQITFVKLDGSLADNQMERYCFNLPCNYAFEHHFTYNSTCLHSKSSFTGFSIEFYSEWMHKPSVYRNKVVREADFECDQINQYLYISEQGTKTCLLLTNVTSSSNIVGSPLFWIKSTRKAYKTFEEIPGTFLFTEELKEIVSPEECIARGLILFFEENKCISECRFKVFKYRNDISSAHTVANGKFVLICLLDLEAATLQSTKDHLTRVFGYEEDLDNFFPLEEVIFFDAIKHIGSSIDKFHWSGYYLDSISEEGLPLEGFRQNSTCFKKLHINFEGNTRIANTCQESGTKANYYSFTDEDIGLEVDDQGCAHFGLVGLTNSNGNIEKRCIEYSNKSEIESKFDIVNGLAFEKSFCETKDYNDAKYFYEMVVNNSYMRCSFDSANKGNNYLLPVYNQEELKGYLVTTDPTSCNSFVGYAWNDDRVCISGEECKNQGKMIERVVEDGFKVYKCAQCSQGLKLDANDGFCRESCPENMILVFENLQEKECTDYIVESALTNDLQEVLKLKSGKYLKIAQNAGTGILGYNYYTEIDEGETYSLKQYYNNDEASCTGNSVVAEHNGVKICIPKTDCDMLTDFGLQGGKCVKWTAGVFMHVDSQRQLISATDCQTLGKYTLESIGGKPAKCISNDECNNEGRIPSNIDNTCATTCTETEEFYNNNDESKKRCVASCSANFHSVTVSSVTKCVTDATCSKLGLFVFTKDSSVTCYPEFNDVKTAQSDLICNMTTRKCSPVADISTTCPVTLNINLHESMCVDDNQVGMFRDKQYFQHIEGTKKEMLLLSECQTKTDKINFQAKTCGVDFDAATCVEEFAVSTIDSKKYCVNHYYCVTEDNTALSYFWNIETKQCVKKCTEISKIGLFKTGHENRTCVTETECFEKRMIVDTQEVGGNLVGTQCVLTCADRLHIELSSVSDTKSVSARRCYTACPTNYSPYKTNECLKNEDCIFRGSACEFKFGDDLGTERFYRNTDVSNTIVTCDTNTDLLFHNAPHSIIKSSCYSPELCMRDGGYLYLTANANGDYDYTCHFYCDKEHTIHEGGLVYCLDDCIFSLKDYSNNLNPIDYDLQIESNLVQSCQKRGTCDTENYFYKDNRCSSKKLCNSAFGSIIKKKSSDTTEDECIGIDECKCDGPDCILIPGSDFACFTLDYCKSLTDHIIEVFDGRMTCRKRKTGDPEKGWVTDHDECSLLKDQDPDMFFYEGNDGERLCLTRDECKARDLFKTKDNRCLTFEQCKADTESYFIYSEANLGECVSKFDCESRELVPYEENHMVEGNYRTCYKCDNIKDEYYMPPVLTTNRSYDFCVKSCHTGTFKNPPSFTCLKDCPLFLNPTEEFCDTICPNNFITIRAGQNDVCNDDKLCKTGLHIDTDNSYKYDNSHTCVASCPDGYRQFRDKCVVCASFFFEDTCYSNCPQFTVPLNQGSSSATCQDCSKLTGTFVYYKGSCVAASTLNLNSLALVSDKYKGYSDCSGDFVLEANAEGVDTCVKECSKENFGKYRGRCVECKPIITELYTCAIELGIFRDTNTCSSGYVINPQKPYLCITVSEFESVKKELCPGVAQARDEFGVCVACNTLPGQLLIADENRCQSTCPDLTEPNLETSTCDPCERIYEGVCVDKCTNNTILVDRICTVCPQNTIATNNECKPICSEESIDSEQCVSESGSNSNITDFVCINGIKQVVNNLLICICNEGFTGESCETLEVNAKVEVVEQSRSIVTQFGNLVPQTLQITDTASSNSELVSISSKITQIISSIPPGQENDAVVSREVSKAINSVNNYISECNQFIRTEMNSVKPSSISKYTSEYRRVVAIAKNALNRLRRRIATRLFSSGSNRLLQVDGEFDYDLYKETQIALRDYVSGYIFNPSLRQQPEMDDEESVSLVFYPFTLNEEENKTIKDWSVAKNVPLVDLTACLEGFKQKEEYFLVGLIEWKLITFSQDSSNEIEFHVYSGKTKEKIDCTGFESNLWMNTQKVSRLTPFKTKALNLKSIEVNMFDPFDPFYKQRCFNYSENEEDYTIGMRDELIFPQYKLTCSTGCIYMNYDSDYRLNCQCINTNEAKAVTVPYRLNSGPAEFPFEMFECNFRLDSEYGKIWSNFALYAYIAVLSLTLLLLVVLSILQWTTRILDSNALEKNDRLDTENAEQAELARKNHIEPSEDNKYSHAEMNFLGWRDMLHNDNRSVVEHYVYHMKRNVAVLAPFLSNSLSKPWDIRVIELGLVMASCLFFNSLWFMDKNVEHHYYSSNSKWTKIFASFWGGWDRVLYSIISTFAIRICFYLMWKPSREAIEGLSIGFKHKDSFDEAYEEFSKLNRIKYVIFVISAVIYFGLCVWYSLALNDFYPNIGEDWLAGGIWTFIFFTICQFGLLAVYSGLWKFAKFSKITFPWGIARKLII